MTEKIDQKLWEAATAERRKKERRVRCCALVFLILLAALVVWSYFQPNKELYANIFIPSVMTGSFALMFALFGALPDQNGAWEGSGALGDQTSLETLINYLVAQTIEPKREFVERCNKQLQEVNQHLANYASSIELLSGIVAKPNDPLREANEADLARAMLVQAALRSRRAALTDQIEQAGQIVAPVAKQIALLQGHLSRLTQDQYVARTQKLVIEIDQQLPINQQFLLGLQQQVVSTSHRLNEMIKTSTALQNAVGEIEKISPSIPADELELKA